MKSCVVLRNFAQTKARLPSETITGDANLSIDWQRVTPRQRISSSGGPWLRQASRSKSAFPSRKRAECLGPANVRTTETRVRAETTPRPMPMTEAEVVKYFSRPTRRPSNTGRAISAMTDPSFQEELDARTAKRRELHFD